MSVLTSFEYARVAVGGDISSNISKEFFEQLFRSQLQLPTGAVAFQRDAVTFSSYCGLIQAGGDSVEILPKIYRDGASTEQHRTLLIEMLSLCYDLDMHLGSAADVALQSQNLLHVFVAAFCRELTKQLRGGLIRTYVQHAENLAVLKGRINWHQQIRENVTHRERVFCEFDELSHDNAYNQVIKHTLLVLKSLVRGHETLAERVHSLWLYFDGVEDVAFRGTDVRKLTRNRLVSRYEVVLRWCEWFLNRVSPDVYSGKQSVFSMLFDMNDLFQTYVYRLARRAAATLPDPSSIVVRSETPQRYLMRRTGSGRSHFLMKPDITVSDGRSGKLLLIIDTKWKRLDPMSKWGFWGIGQDDVYQMLAYGSGYGCGRLVLLYPDHETIEGSERPSFVFDVQSNIEIQLDVRTVRLDGDRSARIRTTVTEQLRALLIERSQANQPGSASANALRFGTRA